MGDSGQTITLDWEDTGGELCVNVQYTCSPPLTACKQVNVFHLPPTVLPPVKICAEDAPYQLPWGEEAPSSGTYSTTIQSPEGCDSTLMQTVTILPANATNLPNIVLCPNTCLIKCGQSFCDYGNHSVTCQSYLGCDSVINFTIIPPNLVADILGAGSITCADTSITLSAAPTSGVKTWTNSAGQQLGDGSLLTVNSPGTYFLTVTMTIAGEICALSDSIVIPLNNLPPTIMATGASIGCDTLPVMVHVDSLPGLETYSWSGPNGFVSNQQNPTVTELGTYIVTVVDLTNGCSAKDTVLVKSCCSNSAGNLDSTLITICGKKDLLAGFHWDQHLTSGDSLAFILYSDSVNPLSSILMYSDTTLFPFVDSLLHLDSLYYVAAVVGQVLPDTTINLHGACRAVSPGQPVRWASKPSITVSQADVVCRGDCLDLLFQFTGTPPFNFQFDITQNGLLMLSQDVVSDSLQKTLTICPSAFYQPQGHGALHFSVNYFQDAVCNCND